jgi:DNA-binding NarL/FixJ family response regulator
MADERAAKREGDARDTIRVMVVDDQQLIREGIASLLDIQDDMQVVATPANGQLAVERAPELAPDIILMDVRMPVLDGVQAAALISDKLPTCRILMLTTFDDEEYVVQALRAGAKGYLLKDIPPGDLAQAIRLAHAGIFQLDPEVAGKLVGALANATRSRAPSPTGTSESGQATANLPHRLTPREIEVLRYIALGATNREIATHLVVSEGTVKNHISNILMHLGLRDRVQAAIYAHEHHLL